MTEEEIKQTVKWQFEGLVERWLIWFFAYAIVIQILLHF